MPDELLIAYVEDRLDRAERERIELAIARDGQLAQRVARFRAAQTRRQGASGGALQQRRRSPRSEPPRRVLPAGPAQIIDLARVRAERMRRIERTHRTRTAARGFGVLVGLLVGLFAGWFIERWSSGDNLTEFRAGALLARGALQRALEEQLASEPARGAVRIGISLRARAGGFCRTFELAGSALTDGLACKAGERWRLLALVDGSAASHVFMPLPPGLLAAVNANASGQPLDPAGETQARRNGWH
jgi:anti-sigma factor RsiW